MGKKTESLLKLKALRVNIPVFEVLTNSEEVRNFLKQSMPRRWDAYSIRTDNKKGQIPYKKWGLPFFPNKNWGEVRDILNKELLHLVDRELDIIMAEGIDPKDSLISGRYLKDLEGEDVVDYITGSSTGRDIEKRTPKEWKPTSSEVPPEQMQFSRIVNYVKYSFSHAFEAPFVVEFSIYPYPIGRLKDKLIFWEVIEIS
jgi:hypothetical protein